MKALIFIALVLLSSAQAETLVEMQYNDLSLQACILLTQGNLPGAQQRIDALKSLIVSEMIVPTPNAYRDRAINLVINKLGAEYASYINNNKQDQAQTVFKMMMELNSYPTSYPEGRKDRGESFESAIIKLAEVANSYFEKKNNDNAISNVRKMLEIFSSPFVVIQGSAKLDDPINYVVARLAVLSVFAVNDRNLDSARNYINLMTEVNKIPGSTTEAKEARSKFFEPLILKLAQGANSQIDNSLDYAKNYVNLLIQVNNLPATISAEKSTRDSSISSIMAKLSQKAVSLLESSTMNFETAERFLNYALEVNKIPVTSTNGKELRREAVKAAKDKLRQEAGNLIKAKNMTRARQFFDLSEKLGNETA